MKYLFTCIPAYLIAGFVLTCLQVIPGRAQQSTEAFHFEHITVNEGLSHSDAMTVAQDQQGFIWVGTNKGINRYDGYTLKKYDLPLNDQTGLASNRIKTVFVSPQGRIWVGTERAGLFYYQASKDTFTGLSVSNIAPAYRPLAQILSQATVSSITSDAQGRVWIGTARYGVFVLQSDTQGQISKIWQIHLKPFPFPEITSNALIANTHVSYEPSISRVVADKHNTIWIATLGDGLWSVLADSLLHPRKWRQATRVHSLDLPVIRILHLDRRGDLWLGTDTQVLWVAGKQLTRYSSSSRSATGNPVLQAQALNQTFGDIESLYLDSFHRLWIGTSFGLLMVAEGTSNGIAPPVNESGTHTFLPLDTDPFSINSVRVHEMLEDGFHNLWLATSAGGLNQLKLHHKPFQQLRRQLSGQHTPASNYINSIHYDSRQNLLWMGTRNGFASYDFSKKTYINYLNQAFSCNVNGTDVTSFCQTANGTLWIGTRFRGLFTIRTNQTTPGRQPLIKITNTPGHIDWAQISIEHIIEDRWGNVWIATFNAGLIKLDSQGNYIRSYTTSGGVLPSQQITYLLYDRQNDILWASTRDAGLLQLQLSDNSLTLRHQYRHEPTNPHSLQTNYVWPLLKDSAGNLWIGTIGGGLHRLSTTKAGEQVIERYQKWVPETDVESLLTDDAGNLWMGGQGLYQFNPFTKRVIQYDVTDGLQSNAFKVGAAFRSADGTMYFGGTNGISYFQPSQIRDNLSPPLVQITGLRILNHPVATGDTLNGRVLIDQPLSSPQTVSIKASENDFSIEFVGINYDNPQKHRYAYQLKGYHTEWVYAPSGMRVASFANLPAGTYTFMVKASNGDGIWSEANDSLTLVILPPWWKTWWAYTFYTLGVLAVLALYRHITHKQQQLRSRLAIEKFQHTKDTEINALKLRFFTNVSHELRTPLTLILGPMEELLTASSHLPGLKDKVLLMHQQSRKLLDLVNQLLDFRKVESGHITLRVSKQDMIAFVTELFLIFKLKAQEQTLDYSLDLPSYSVPMHFDRNKMEIVLTNLLSNAFKYTPSGNKIQVSANLIGNPAQAAAWQDGKLFDNYLEIRIQDWGIGIHPKEVDKIFDPYYQASQTETLKMIGTGIGLSLVKQLVERQSGEICVQSTPDKGTLFTIRLPFGSEHLLPEDLSPANATSQEMPTEDFPELPQESDIIAVHTLPKERFMSEPHPGSTSGRLRILLVEDNPDVLAYLKQTFESGFEILTAPDGLQGWHIALDTCPDLVISDVMMPNSDGMELCNKLKQHPKTMHIPVILLTAQVATVHQQQGLETGADDYITKPFNPIILYAKASAILRNRLKLQTYYQRQILLDPTELAIPDEDKQFLEKAMKIVESRISEQQFNVQILVHQMGMSQSVFYRRIKSITGQTVVEFIRDIRMRRAAQLLGNTSLRVSEIAFEVGIEDLKYFRQSFQKIFNATPSEYAKAHRKGIHEKAIESDVVVTQSDLSP